MKKFFSATMILLCMTAVCLIYSCSIQYDLSSNLLRMHIIANSNSVHDQEIKLKVRDEILNTVSTNPTLNSIEETARTALNKLSENCSVKVCFENCYVPEKSYKNIRLPEGQYNCLKVILGSGNGENWWCVAYPPLCYTEDMFGEMSESGQKQLEKVLDRDTLKSIINSGDVNIRFKIVEEMQKLYRHLCS